MILQAGPWEALKSPKDVPQSSLSDSECLSFTFPPVPPGVSKFWETGCHKTLICLQLLIVGDGRMNTWTRPVKPRSAKQMHSGNQTADGLEAVEWADRAAGSRVEGAQLWGSTWFPPLLVWTLARHLTSRGLDFSLL